MYRALEAAGRRNSPGHVYIMRDGQQFKIGCSQDPEIRLQQIQRQPGREATTLLHYFMANEMNGAETAAQQRVIQNLGLRKIA